jgi:hypothetical protein
MTREGIDARERFEAVLAAARAAIPIGWFLEFDRFAARYLELTLAQRNTYEVAMRLLTARPSYRDLDPIHTIADQLIHEVAILAVAAYRYVYISDHLARYRSYDAERYARIEDAQAAERRLDAAGREKGRNARVRAAKKAKEHEARAEAIRHSAIRGKQQIREYEQEMADFEPTALQALRSCAILAALREEGLERHLVTLLGSIQLAKRPTSPLLREAFGFEVQS